MSEFTLLDEEQVFGNKKLDILKKYGTRAAITDFAILLGAELSLNYHVKDDSSLKGRSGGWHLSSYRYGNALTVGERSDYYFIDTSARTSCVRPVLSYSSIQSISSNVVREVGGIKEIEYGEYPQFVVNKNLSRRLFINLSKGKIKRTGKTYTTDSRSWDSYSKKFNSVEHEEFEYKGKKYVLIKSNNTIGNTMLSNGTFPKPENYYWVEVAPIKWLCDDNTGLMLSKTCLISGIRFCDDKNRYDDNFKTTEMYMYLNKYFAKDIIPSMTKEEKLREETSIKKQINSYNFNFSNVSEEDIIKGAIESGVAVFLHGLSSEGKSARVKQIDPTCEIIYLRNATPDSLNGKSVYNSTTGEMIDIKPTWLTKLEEKCEKEKDRLHIVFFDEITNALPSIQGISFNIILDREVNGKWKLPDNARVVAAGNDMKDSLAANKLAEPLFNRFAHVYIKTTTESWLKWASENNIHPAIYSYIAYKNGSTLRSEYNGEKPNADPRKWEMASKMLYQTGNPEMLRCLVGEDITKEFVTFCKSRVITLEDVLNGNYTDNDIESLNTAEKYATVMTLSQVNEDNLETVRDFTSSLGKEYTSVFDTLWSHNEEDRLEKLQEIKLENGRKTRKLERK